MVHRIAPAVPRNCPCAAILQPTVPRENFDESGSRSVGIIAKKGRGEGRGTSGGAILVRKLVRSASRILDSCGRFHSGEPGAASNITFRWRTVGNFNCRPSRNLGG